nr:prepilin-type N-terminal cleavage/methylation domain-containing protein [Thioalkalivibrio sp. ALJ15]
MTTVPNRAPGRGGQHGFTLVELMVGILVATLVIAAVAALYITVIRGAIFVTQEARLTQETRVAMDMMINDIRRSGYSHPSRIRQEENDLPDNPFMRADDPPVRDIRIHGDDCLLMAYDPTFSYAPGENHPYDLSDLSAENEQYVFGYRLRDGVIQILHSSHDQTSNSVCNRSSGWEPITDPETTRVSQLRFSTAGSVCMNASADNGAYRQVTDSETSTPACSNPPDETQSGDVLVEMRRINILLEAEHAQDSSTRTFLNESAKARNHRVIWAP